MLGIRFFIRFLYRCHKFVKYEADITLSSVKNCIGKISVKYNLWPLYCPIISSILHTKDIRVILHFSRCHKLINLYSWIKNVNCLYMLKPDSIIGTWKLFIIKYVLFYAIEWFYGVNKTCICFIKSSYFKIWWLIKYYQNTSFPFWILIHLIIFIINIIKIIIIIIII